MCVVHVGGASLVNYGISVRPDDRVFDDWPVSSVDLAPCFERALEVLSSEVSPRAATLGDAPFLDRVEPGRRRDIACTIDWSRCDDCGRCDPGCRRGAKRTLEDTYLERALAAAGLEVRVETEVVGLAPAVGGGWELVLRGRAASSACGRAASSSPAASSEPSTCSTASGQRSPSRRPSVAG